MKENFVTMDGSIIGVNRNSATVELANGSVIRGIISGRMMRHRIKIVVGDKVEVEIDAL
jgi:translation initiation factor IF-1